MKISKEKLNELYTEKGLSLKKCAEILGIYRATVKKRLEEYEIPIRQTKFILSRKKWNKNEEDFLMKNYPTKGLNFVAKHLGRDRGSVSHKADRMGISFEKIKPWSEKEIKKVFKLYKTKGLKYTANKLNRTLPSVAGVVAKYKLKTDLEDRKKRISATLKKKFKEDALYRGHLLSTSQIIRRPESRAKLSASLKKYYKTHAYPESAKLKLSKLFKGKIVKESTKEKLRAYRGPLASRYGKKISKIARKKLIRSLIKAYAEGRKKVPVSKKYKGGFRKDLGFVVRSTYEANFARILNYLKIKYDYEPKRFKIVLPNNKISTYLPDFVIKNKYIFEVKGFFEDDAEEKFHIFKKQYPEYKTRLITMPIYYCLLSLFKAKVHFEMENYTAVLIKKYKSIKRGLEIKQLLIELAKNKEETIRVRS